MTFRAIAEQHDIAFDVLKASPPVGVAAATVAGMTLSDWAYALTIVYTALLIVQHVWKHWIKPHIKRPSQ